MRFQLTKPLAGLLLVMLMFSNVFIVEAQTLQEQEKKTTSKITTTPTATPTPSPPTSETPVLEKGDDKVEKNVADKPKVIYRCPKTNKRAKKVRTPKKRAVKKAVVVKKSSRKKSATRRKAPRKKAAKPKVAEPKAVTPATPVIATVTLTDAQLQQIVDTVSAKLGANKLSDDDKTTVRQIVSEELNKTKADRNNSSNTALENNNGDQVGDENQQSWLSSTLESVLGAASGLLTWMKANWHLIALLIAVVVLWLLSRKYRWMRWLSYVAIALLLYFWGFFSWLLSLVAGNLAWVLGLVVLAIIAGIGYLFRADIASFFRNRNQEPPSINPHDDLYGDVPEAEHGEVIETEPVIDDDDNPDNRTS